MTPYRRNEIAWHAYCQASCYSHEVHSGSVWSYLWGAWRHERDPEMRRLLDRLGSIAVPDRGPSAGCIVAPLLRNSVTPVTRNVTPAEP